MIKIKKDKFLQDSVKPTEVIWNTDEGRLIVRMDNGTEFHCSEFNLTGGMIDASKGENK